MKRHRSAVHKLPRCLYRRSFSRIKCTDAASRVAKQRRHTTAALF